MPAPYDTQGLQAFFFMGQNKDENGHKYSSGISAAGKKEAPCHMAQRLHLLRISKDVCLM